MEHEHAPAADAEPADAVHPRRVIKVVLASALVLAVATAGLVVLAYRHLDSNLRTEDYEAVFVEPRPENEAVEGPGEPIDILVMGSDSRAGENDIDGLRGLGDRSDTTILLHLSADRTRAYGVSIPRDTLVTRPDCKDPDTGEVVPGGRDQEWNIAFQVAGPGCTQSQFEQITGIRVDHTVVVDFSGFQDMVDAVGGVSVCIPQTIDDREHGIYLEAGTRSISGKEALSYVRVRQGSTPDGEQAVDGSDPGRIRRQQAFVASMAREVVSADTLANPVRLYRFLDAATRSLELGQIDSLRQMAQIGTQFRGIGLGDIRFLTIPWEYTPDFLRVRLLPEADDVWARLRADRALTAAQVADAITAANAPGETADAGEQPGAESSGEEPGGESTGEPSTPSTPTTSEPSLTPEQQEARRQAGLCS